MYRGNVSLAQRYLEDKVTGGGLSNYSLCLAAYALALASSPVAGTALAELSSRADYKGNLLQVFCCFLFRYVQKSHFFLNVLQTKILLKIFSVLLLLLVPETSSLSSMKLVKFVLI